MEAKATKNLKMVQMNNTVNIISPNSPEDNEAIARVAKKNLHHDLQFLMNIIIMSMHI